MEDSVFNPDEKGQMFGVKIMRNVPNKTGEKIIVEGTKQRLRNNYVYSS